MKVKYVAVELRFFEKRGDFRREVHNEYFEIENVTKEDVLNEDGTLTAEFETTMLVLAGLTREDLVNFCSYSIECYEDEYEREE